jgi:AraC-like DNA-binding protein
VVGVVDESVRSLPAPALRPFIAHYSGYRQAGVEPGRHRGLPSPYLTLIFTLDEPLTLAAHPDPEQPPGEYGTLLGGLHTSPALITHQGWQSGIQLALSPLGARPLLGLPAGELANADLPADDVLGPLAAEIHERVRAAASWRERFAVIDRLLLGRLEDGGQRRMARQAAGQPTGLASAASAVSAEVEFAWRSLLRTGGTVHVSDLVEESGWSDRHLRNRFHAETGLTPKAAARVIRFDRARRLMRRRSAGGQLVIADLAADCGYYDQPHLAREFRALAGCGPASWLAEEFRNVQSGVAGLVPGSPHE